MIALNAIITNEQSRYTLQFYINTTINLFFKFLTCIFSFIFLFYFNDININELIYFS